MKFTATVFVLVLTSLTNTAHAKEEVLRRRELDGQSQADAASFELMEEWGVPTHSASSAQSKCTDAKNGCKNTKSSKSTKECKGPSRSKSSKGPSG